LKKISAKPLQKKEAAENILQKEFVQKQKSPFKKIKHRLKKISAKPLQKKEVEETILQKEFVQKENPLLKKSNAA
jgi:hypothetical protein